jgi:hypothetical protein
MAATDVFAVVGPTISVAATAASASASYTEVIAEGAANIRVYNAGPNTAFVRFGFGAQTAVLTDTPVPAGVIENFFVGAADTCAAICAATQTATVYFTPGNGI